MSKGSEPRAKMGVKGTKDFTKEPGMSKTKSSEMKMDANKKKKKRPA